MMTGEEGRPAGNKAIPFPGDETEACRYALERALQAILHQVHAEEQLAAAMAKLRRAPWYGNLCRKWPRLSPGARERQWRQAQERLRRLAYSCRPYCVRCGECCQQGGPSLHPEDEALLAAGVVANSDLCTLRRGELVRDNLAGALRPLTEELIKVAAADDGSCTFYQAAEKVCAIYQQRPLQCRQQACWDPVKLRRLWKRPKLCRQDLVVDEELLAVIARHEERCDAGRFHLLASRAREGNPAAISELLAMLRFDHRARVVLASNKKKALTELQFYLGRPLADLLCLHGLRLREDREGRYRLGHI